MVPQALHAFNRVLDGRERRRELVLKHELLEENRRQLEL